MDIVLSPRFPPTGPPSFTDITPYTNATFKNNARSQIDWSVATECWRQFRLGGGRSPTHLWTYVLWRLTQGTKEYNIQSPSITKTFLLQYLKKQLDFLANNGNGGAFFSKNGKGALYIDSLQRQTSGKANTPRDSGHSELTVRAAGVLGGWMRRWHRKWTLGRTPVRCRPFMSRWIGDNRRSRRRSGCWHSSLGTEWNVTHLFLIYLLTVHLSLSSLVSENN